MKRAQMSNMKRISAAALAAVLAAGLVSCGDSSSSAIRAAQQTQSAAPPAADEGELYNTKQAVRPSPEWVTRLDALKDAQQVIVVAGVDKSTAYITMHEKSSSGEWQQIIATPGFIGLEGLGDANIEQTLTPIGTFTVDKAFGLADDPGCAMDYVKVDDSFYWSGDQRLDTEASEHISDYDAAYQYVLNIGYNAECEEKKGFAFFLHCFRINRPYTGGCVAVPENIMRFIMQHIKPGCRVTIDSLEALGGDLDS